MAVQRGAVAHRLRLAAVLVSRRLLPVRSGGSEPIKFPDTQYQPVDLAEPRWLGRRRSRHGVCHLSRKLPRAERGNQPVGPAVAIADALKPCLRARLAAVPLEEDGARKFFEDNFRPLRISKLGDTDGFLTGYYEPIIEGSRVPTGEFTAPLYRRPPNLVVSGRRKLGDAFPSKGVKVGRRVGRRKIVPYLRSRRDRGWRARRLASGNLLSAQPDRRAVRANSGIGAHQAGRRHHSARQLRLA